MSKSNSQRVDKGGFEFIRQEAAWSVRIKGEQTVAGDEPDLEAALDAADRKSAALLMFDSDICIRQECTCWFQANYISRRGWTTSRAIHIAIMWIFPQLGYSSALCGVKSWIFSFIFLQSSSQLSSLTLGTAINLSDWLRSGARSRSSPGAPSVLSRRENKEVPLIETGIV